jgi:hypothetical protein
MAASLAAVALIGAALAVPAAAGAATGPAGPSGPSVRLAGGEPSVPEGASITGPTDAREGVTADVALKPRDPAALSAFVDAVSTPGSPQYHRYLAAGRFASLFGPTAAAVGAVRAWLASSGLHVGPTSPDGLLMPVTGSAAQVARALRVSLANARLPGGRVARLAEEAPAVPSALAPSLAGVIGLSTVAQPQPQIVLGPGTPRPVPGPRTPVPHVGPVPCAPASQAGGYTADQLAAAYGLNTLYGGGLVGAGQTVGIYELEPFDRPDITTYLACYGLSNSVTPVPVDGGAVGGQQGEAALDIEDVAGLAPGAAIRVYSGPQIGSGPIDTYSRMVTDDVAKVISTSWGLCEPQMATQPGVQAVESSLFAEAAVQGQTVVAASGDSGSSDCYVPGADADPTVTVDDPADQPGVTGVGGTSLLAPGPAPTETAWNDLFGSGGGGVSSDFAMPTWQLGPGVGSALAVSNCSALGRTSCREVPDVSASSDPARGYAVFFGGQWRVAGGTSAASPLWAAMTAVIDQGLGSPAGLMNPTLYGAGSCAVSPFNDVTVGNNSFLMAGAGRYPATPNYDLASGWGSPVAARLLGDLASPPNCPVVTAVRPTKGAPGGGNTVTVTGANFSQATSVRFGDVPATSFSVTSPGSVVARVPPGPAGGTVVDVTVSDPGGTSRTVAADRYAYVLPGYWLEASDGGIFTFGHAGFAGSTGGTLLNKPVVGMAPTADDRGYWLVASDGGIFTFGDAAFYGSTGALTLNKPIVGMAATPSGFGYWLVASDGGIFSFGDAAFYGSTGAIRLNRPIVGMAATPGGGYWLVAADGGIFSFGDAAFHGSTGAIRLNRPIVGMAATPSGHGYWLVAGDGGIFTFGDAGFHGSTGAIRLNRPIVGMASTPSGHGYWLVAGDGGIFTFGDAAFYGSTGAINLNKPIVGMAST